MCIENLHIIILLSTRSVDRIWFDLNIFIFQKYLFVLLRAILFPDFASCNLF